MFRPSVRILLGSYRFVPDLLCLLLTSAWISRHLSVSVALWHPCRSPRVLRTHLHAYACRIYAASFCASIGLCRNSPAHPNASPRIRFLFVRPAFCLGLPSDSQSPTTPLPSANTSPCRVCRGLSPPSKCALPGARIDTPPLGAGSFIEDACMVANTRWISQSRTASGLTTISALTS